VWNIGVTAEPFSQMVLGPTASNSIFLSFSRVNGIIGSEEGSYGAWCAVRARESTANANNVL